MLPVHKPYVTCDAALVTCFDRVRLSDQAPDFLYGMFVVARNAERCVCDSRGLFV